mmetsp:Transcript_27818/g.64855  ORF Transcript_27818/g.64855 Transcript_27818/m.64855 type:complete len:102 (-) Transcript_27818:250-555(-)
MCFCNLSGPEQPASKQTNAAMGCSSSSGAGVREGSGNNAEEVVAEINEGGGDNAEVHEQDTTWGRLGGRELEGPIREGLVALVRADWLVELSERGGTLSRR